MSGKARPFRLTDGQRVVAEANIGLAWSVAPAVRRAAWWLDEDDVLSLCCEALCRAVAAHERRRSTHRLGSFVGVQAMALVSAARSYALAACRKETRRPCDEPAARYDRSRPAEDAVADSDAAGFALAGLSRRQRQAVEAHVMLGLSRSEAAERIGCSPASVDVHAKRGMAKARKAMGVA